MSDEIKVCPECDSTHITKRIGKNGPQIQGDETYRCQGCYHRFDEPHMRERHRSKLSGATNSQKILLEMDPDEIP